MKRWIRCAAIVWIGTLVGPLWAQEATKPEVDPAEWAPADAIFYLGIQDTAKLRKDFENTSAYAALKDKDMAAAAGMGAEMWNTVVEKLKQRLARMLDVDPAELKDPFAGPLALYVVAPPGGHLDDLQGVLIAGVGDPAVMGQYVAAVTTRLKEGATNYEAVPAGRHTIQKFTKAPGTPEQGGAEEKTDEFDFGNETPSTPLGAGPAAVGEMIDKKLEKLFSFEDLPKELALCLTDDRLLVSGSAEHIRQALALEPGAQTLAGTDDHKTLLKELRPVGQVRLLVNLPRLFELARASEDDADAVRDVMALVGAGSLRSVVGHLRVGAKSYDTKAELLFLMSGERTGLAKLLSMENRPVEPPPWVASGTAVFFSLNIDPPRLTDDILRIMTQNDAQVGASAAAALEKGPPGPDGQPLNWRKDLIDYLAGPLIGMVRFARPCGPGSLRALLSLGHRNREALTRVLAILSGGMPPRDFRGTPIYADPTSGASIAITDNQALYGNQAAVEAALSAPEAAGLADDEDFKRAAQYVPREAWLTAYFNGRELMGALFELAGKQSELVPGSAEATLLMMMQMGGMKLADTPESKKMLEYTSSSILTVATTSEGVQLTLVGLKANKE